MVAGLIHTRSKYNAAFTCENTLLLAYALATYIPIPSSPSKLSFHLCTTNNHYPERLTSHQS